MLFSHKTADNQNPITQKGEGVSCVTLPPLQSSTERGVYDASPFRSPQAEHFIHGHSKVEAA